MKHNSGHTVMVGVLAGICGWGIGFACGYLAQPSPPPPTRKKQAITIIKNTPSTPPTSPTIANKHVQDCQHHVLSSPGTGLSLSPEIHVPLRLVTSRTLTFDENVIAIAEADKALDATTTGSLSDGDVWSDLDSSGPTTPTPAKDKDEQGKTEASPPQTMGHVLEAATAPGTVAGGAMNVLARASADVSKSMIGEPVPWKP